jgi:DNA processing protein
VGARKATAYGKWAAHSIAKRAAVYGIAVVSGMADGIDSAAHRGAIEGEGGTIAVLGCGIDICYPKSNRELWKKIAGQGLLLSEYSPGTPPMPFRFPLRNRIISGLSEVVVIAEAGLSSGSLITAQLAADQGRDVYAVPGNINATASIGGNKLIRDGAIPVVVIDDVLEAMGIRGKRRVGSMISNLGKDEKDLLNSVSEEGETTLDRLCKMTGKPASEVSALVTILEMKGELMTSMGKIFIAKY